MLQSRKDSKNKNYLFIVCNKGLEFKYCDKCKDPIKDDICFCNNCKKCLHLKCAGVKKKNWFARFNDEPMLPAPEALPKSCHDCLIRMRSIVGSNIEANRIPISPATIHPEPIGSNNANRIPKSPATIDKKSIGSDVASSSNNTNRRNTKSPATSHKKTEGSSVASSSNNTNRHTKSPANSHQKPKGSSVNSRSNNPNRNPKSPAPNHQEPIRSSDASSSNSGLRQMVGSLGTYAKNSLISGIKSILEPIIQPEHELSGDKYDDCWDHKNKPDHELKKEHNGTFYSCFGCKVNSFGPHYACRICSFKLHEDCKSPRKFMMHPFFPKSSFAFAASPKIEHFKHRSTVVNCNACGMDVNGYIYESLNGYKKYLHPCCANLPRQIISGESKAIMVLKQNTTSDCSYCSKTTIMVGNKKTDQIWSYVSRSETVHLHVHCIIKMLSNLMSDNDIGSTSVLTILPKKTEVNYSMTKYEFQIAADANRRWETEFKNIIKYAKIALGAIIASVLGDPSTFIINCTVTFKS